MKLSNNAYDTLKAFAMIWLPMIAAICIGLGEIWSIEFMTPVGASLTLIDTALGAALDKLAKDYHNSKEE